MENIEKELSKYIYARLQDIADALDKGIRKNKKKNYLVEFKDELCNYRLTFQATNVEECINIIKKTNVENVNNIININEIEQ